MVLDAPIIMQVILSAIMAVIALMVRRMMQQMDENTRQTSILVTQVAVMNSESGTIRDEVKHCMHALEDHKTRLEMHYGEIVAIKTILSHEDRCSGFRLGPKKTRATDKENKV